MTSPTCNKTDVKGEPSHPVEGRLDRRSLLVGTSVALAAAASVPVARHFLLPRASVFIARGQRYDGSLVRTIEDGLSAAGVELAQLRGRRVLLKPNLVEPMRTAPHMTTHPAVVLAAAEVLRRHGAEVTVGEAPGHVRDTELALVESGMQDALARVDLPFADLNYAPVLQVPNRGHVSDLPHFYFPRVVAEADLIVSLPKLKTHHWAGLTASMKNLYGVLPGIKYGWPKNVLHHHGIHQTVCDINASLPPTVTVVDAIDCMEGDGPIMGSRKPMGLLLIGANLPAVDATCARIMGLNPERVGYLNLAADRLGPIAEQRIHQRGETWRSVANSFQILDTPVLRPLRDGAELVS